MHEFSLANQTVDEIIANAQERGAKRICRVELLVGELNLLGEEQLIFWIKQILSSKGKIASDVKIDFKPIPGRELILNKIEIEK
jgi:Zn finger protein HypA/HybF involved in hydrogenase expression